MQILMLQDWKLMRSGVAPFNGVLVGTGLQAFAPMLLHDDALQPVVLALVCVGSFATWVTPSLAVEIEQIICMVWWLWKEIRFQKVMV